MTTRVKAAAMRERLQNAGVADAAFEARVLLETALGKESATRLYVCDEPFPDFAQQTLDTLLKRRIAGEPLQYICGSWDFLDCSFLVGEGVLIPRPETEELVLLALERMNQMHAPTVFDLCAGTGCIGLSVKRRRADANVCLFELSESALAFCEKNRNALGYGDTVPVIRADVLQGFEALKNLSVPDVILSNPPYIASAELPALQREVQREPSMALDGGEDGLVFYRCLVKRWLPFMKAGALVGVECGETQAKTIAGFFESVGFQSEICSDFNDIQRFVFARKGKEREETP